MANPKRTMPRGFEADAKLPHVSLKAKYHCTAKQIARWRGELGLPTGRAGKPVNQYTTDGRFVRRYASMHQASKALGVCVENISRCANRKIPTAYGYVWRIDSAN